MVEADECNADEKADEKQALGFSSTTVSDSDRSSADPKLVSVLGFFFFFCFTLCLNAGKVGK